MRVIDPWERHCVECGEPDCYRTCPKYRAARTGRCDRFDDGRFLEWGKLELLWHGGLSNARVAALVRGANGIIEPLALTLGPRVYRLFRSVRWRLCKAVAWHRCPPTIWSVAVETEREERLRLVLRNRELDVTGEWSLASERVAAPSSQAACRGEIEISLPPVEEGTLFSIFPEGAAASGKIRFVRNELIRPQSASLRPPAPLKCVAWDLDGVVWNGTLSEGEDVRIRPDVIGTIKMLDARGIVSSICSKNDGDVALAKLRELGIEEWFVFPQISWNAKSVGLRRLAEEMNIALDAIAFVDDREENRNEVRANAPAVRVYAETEMARLVEEAGEAAREGTRRTGEAAREGTRRTGELGSRRRVMYREEMARRQARGDFAGDAAAFNRASGMQVELLPVEGERVARCRELVQRTNQLTITARRYSEEAFAQLLASCETRAVHVWDRYGDSGIVGFVAWTAERIVELVFSCRVAHRGVERQVLARLPKGLAIDVVATDRNAPIREIVSAWQKEES